MSRIIFAKRIFFLLTFTSFSAAHANVTLSLEEAMNLSEQKAFLARTAALNTEIADAKVGQSSGMALPRLDLDAQRIWFDKDVNKLAGKSPLSPDRVTTAALQVVQPIIGIGPLLLQIKATQLLLQNAQNDEASAKREARQLGAQAYINLQKANQFVTLASAALNVSENQWREAQALMRAGRIAQADESRFELSLLDAKQQLNQAKTTQELASVSLSEVMNTPDTRYSIEAPKESRFEGLNPSIPLPQSAITEAEKQRPESQNAQNGLEIAEFYKLAGNLDYLPSLNAFARYERNFEAKDQSITTGQNTPPLKIPKDDIKDTFSIGLKLNWNLWDWGTRWNRSSEYAATVQKARIGKEAAESGVRMDVTSSVLQLRSALDALSTARSAVKLSEEVYRLTKVRFQNGQATSTDVILSERDQTRAKSGLVGARGDLDLAWLRYQKSIGKKPSFETAQK